MDHSKELEQSRPFTAVEFCAGYAGIHLGLARAISNLRLVALSEIEAFACANLVAKMEAGFLDPAPVWPDLKTFPNREFHGKVDLLVAGFPCQPFSAAGKRGGSDDPRHLFPYIKQSLIDMRPGAVFLENVEGIISAKLGEGWDDPAGTPVLLHVLRELERVGYRATAGVFSASEAGAPHQRKRVFILGVADSEPERFHEREPEPGTQRGKVEPYQGEDVAGDGDSWGCVWPSRPGEQQYDWEPPRVTANGTKLDNSSSTGSKRSSRDATESGSNRKNNRVSSSTGKYSPSQTQPSLGRDADGSADRLDDAELYVSCDNRVDELRLLGNGVVPATAERAWQVLSARLADCQSE